MYFTQPTTQLLTIADDFAHLSQIMSNGDLKFQFVYSVSQADVFKYNASTVTVTVETQVVAAKPLLGKTQKGFIDTKAIVKNVRTASIDAKTTQQQQLLYTVASTTSDITAYINNDVIPQLRAGAPTSTIPQFNKSKLTLTSVNSLVQRSDQRPVLQRISNSSAVSDVQTILSSSASDNAQTLIIDMITRQGLDPSYILNLTPRDSSATATFGGLSNTQMATEKVTDPASRALNTQLFSQSTNVPPLSTSDVTSSDMVMSTQPSSSDVLDIPVYIVIPNSKLNFAGAAVSQVYVTFEMIDSNTGMQVDTVKKILDLSKFIQVYYTPKLPPSVKVSTSSSSTRANLEIRQVDSGATEIQLYSKSVWVSSCVIDDYTLLGTYALTSKDQPLLIQADMPLNSAVIYRVIAIGNQSTQGFAYTNVVVKPGRYSPIKAVSLVATQVNLGLQIEIRKLPSNVVAIQLLKWNMTTFDRCHTIVNGDACFIDDSVLETDLLTVLDNDVSDQNVYKYVARLIYQDGNVKDFGEALIEFITPSTGEVDVQIDNLVIDTTDTNPDVTFDIVANVSATDLDQVKLMLENQGLIDFFTGDVAAQRNQLAKLIAYSIERVNLNTGERESFGIVTATSFDDNVLSKNQAVKPLEYGYNYRYEIYPALRAPETMFDSFVKSSVDTVTKKPYTFSPAKYLHPMALNQGTLVTTSGASKRYAKRPMSFGRIGDVTTIEASFESIFPKITNQSATYFDRYTNVVTWGIQGDITQVDSFIVMRQVHGIRSLLGMVHSEFANGSCQFVHMITGDDIGALQYVIVPIMNDYSIGAESLTNTLTIESVS